MKIGYKPFFIRQFNKLEKDLQEEVLEKIELLKDISNHQYLKVYKLHGKLNNQFSFSVNYNYRIVFEYITKSDIQLVAIGDHNIYSPC